MPLSPASSASTLHVPKVVVTPGALEAETTPRSAQPQTIENRDSAFKPATTEDKAAQTRMFSLAVKEGCYRIDGGESVAAVMRALGIDPGTSAERVLYAHCGQKPPSPVHSGSSGGTHNCDAAPSPMPDLLPFPVYIVPREPHRYRSPEGEAWLTEMCRKVAGGADYQQIIEAHGDLMQDAEADVVSEDAFPRVRSECTEFRALHDQVMGSARYALLSGRSLPETAAHFSIRAEPDLHSLAMFAAEKIGAPRVRAGESFNAVKKALGISAYGKAVQVLVEAMPDD